MGQDERWALNILEEIKKFVLSKDSIHYSELSCGIEFHFGAKILIGTRWGRVKTRGIAFNRNRVALSTDVHRSKRLVYSYNHHNIEKK